MNFQNKFEKITRMRVNAPFTRIRVNLLEYQLKYLNMSLNTLNFTTDIAGQINFTTGKSPSLQANQLRYRQISTIRNFFDNFSKFRNFENFEKESKNNSYASKRTIYSHTG